MLKDILFQNWLSVADADEIESSCPESLFFLEEAFLREYYPIAQLPEEKFDLVLAKAQEFNTSEEIRPLAWYLYRKFTKVHIREYSPFPEFFFQLGYDSGILYLLVLLSLIPEFEERARRENFPMRYAHDAASRIGTFPTYFAQAFGGRFGIRARSLHFMLHFKDSPMYRIGRFDFILEEKGGPRFPHVYARGDELRIFCGDKWRMDSDGERLLPGGEPQKGEWISSFSDDGATVRGHLVNSRGFASSEITELSRAEWRYVAGPGDALLHVHIPAGGKMLPELCKKSCEEALAFFAEKYPDKDIKLIYTISWIGNDAWADYMPNSNMAALIRSCALFPSPHGNNAGLYFVFGRDDRDFASYPRNNSLEKAVLQCVEDGRPLRSPGMIFLPLPVAK